MELKLTKSGALKWLLLAVATLILQGIMRSLWQLWIAPAGHAVARWTLDLASLGFSSYRNGVYQAVAADDQLQIPIQILNLAIVIYFLILLAYFFDNLRRNDDHQDSLRKTLKDLDTLSGAPTNAAPEINFVELRAETENVLKSVQQSRRLNYGTGIMIGIFVISSYVSWVRLSYINSADAHYHIVLRTVSPYLAPGEQALVESDFTQINNRDDYVRLLARLEAQCKAHGRTVHAFDPW